MGDQISMSTFWNKVESFFKHIESNPTAKATAVSNIVQVAQTGFNLTIGALAVGGVISADEANVLNSEASKIESATLGITQAVASGGDHTSAVNDVNVAVQAFDNFVDSGVVYKNEDVKSRVKAAAGLFSQAVESFLTFEQQSTVKPNV